MPEFKNLVFFWMKHKTKIPSSEVLAVDVRVAVWRNVIYYSILHIGFRYHTVSISQ